MLMNLGTLPLHPTPPGPDGGDGPAPVKILVVDDEPKSLVALEALLEGPGQEVVRASSGAEALRQILRDDFAVILLDVHMPGMDGFETAEMVRQREHSRDTPIIFLTGASRGESFIARGYSVGAVDYILKPIDSDILRSKVAIFVELFRKREQTKQQAEQLAATTAFLHSVMKGATEYAILPLDLGGRLLGWNEGARRIYGYSEDEVVGRETIARLHPPAEATPDALESLLEAALHAAETVEVEVEGLRKDGRRFPASVTIDRRDIEEQAVGFVAIVRDITRLKRAEAERALLIKEQAARQAAERAAERAVLLQGITAGLAAAGTPATVGAVIVAQSFGALGVRAGAIALVNDDGTELVILRAVGYPPGVIAHWQGLALSANVPFAAAVRTGVPIWLDSRTALAERFPLATAIHPGESFACLPLQVEGRPQGALVLSFAESGVLSTDMRTFLLTLAGQTAQALERARLYEAERVARAAAEAAVRTRDQFLSIAAHELKNPVAAVRGSTSLLLRSQQQGTLDSNRLTRFLEVADRESLRLVRLVDELLDVARLQSGLLPLFPEPLDLADLLRSLVAQHERTGDGDRLRLDVRSIAGPVLADPVRLEQVLANVVGNALKYSPDGGEVQITLTDDGDGIVVAVRDSGIGLPAGVAEAIFQPFGRAANAAARNLPGLGLGLYICRSIVQSHGGRIWAESDGEGRGMTLSLWLPVTEQTADVGGVDG